MGGHDRCARDGSVVLLAELSSPVRPDKFGWQGIGLDAHAIVLDPAAPHSLTQCLMITTDGS